MRPGVRAGKRRLNAAFSGRNAGQRPLAGFEVLRCSLPACSPDDGGPAALTSLAITFEANHSEPDYFMTAAAVGRWRDEIRRAARIRRGGPRDQQRTAEPKR
jgi:hypothetical protein